jgi:dTDP-4-amino-4,6-dideoxygalactose transaminase
MMSTSHALSKGVLSLPIYPEMTDSEVDKVINGVIYYFDAW